MFGRCAAAALGPTCLAVRPPPRLPPDAGCSDKSTLQAKTIQTDGITEPFPEPSRWKPTPCKHGQSLGGGCAGRPLNEKAAKKNKLRKQASETAGETNFIDEYRCAPGWPGFGPNQARLGRIRGNLGRSRTRVGQIWLMSCQNRLRSKPGPRLVDSVPMLLVSVRGLAPDVADVGRILCQVRAKFGRVWATVGVASGQGWLNLVDVGPNLVEIGVNLVELGRMLVDFGPMSRAI